jgi:hypothetical protein
VLVLCNFDSPLSRLSATVHQDTNIRRRAVGESFEVSEANDLCLLRIMLCGLFAGTTVDLLVKESVRCRAWHFIPANSCWPRGPRTILCPYTAHNRIRSCDYVTLCLHTLLFPSLLFVACNPSKHTSEGQYISKCHVPRGGRAAIIIPRVETVATRQSQSQSVWVCVCACVCEWVSERGCKLN